MDLNDNLLKTVISDLIEDLKTLYGESLYEVILYGSYAIGNQTDESDIDLALILSNVPDESINSKMIDYVASYELQCGKVLSVVDISLEEFENWKNTLPYYQKIKSEGIVLWRTTVLERIEDEYDMRAYLEAKAEFEKNPKTYTMDEIEKSLDL